MINKIKVIKEKIVVEERILRIERAIAFVELFSLVWFLSLTVKIVSLNII